MQDIKLAIEFVYTLPYFWTSMSWATIIAMFFGALIYDGDVPHAKKGICSVCAYIFMMILVVTQYVVTRYPIVSSRTPYVAYQLFVYPTILFSLSFFWFIGFGFAIWLFRYLKSRR